MRRSLGSSVVYFLETAGSGSPIKIGYTKKLEGRLETHRKRWPELRLMATMPGDHFTEHSVHGYFRPKARVDNVPANRELFHPIAELVDLIASVNVDPSYGRRWEVLIGSFYSHDYELRPREVRAWREGIGLTQEGTAQLFEMSLHDYRYFERHGAYSDLGRHMTRAMATAAQGKPFRDRMGTKIRARRPDVVTHLVRVGTAAAKLRKPSEPTDDSPRLL